MKLPYTLAPFDLNKFLAGCPGRCTHTGKRVRADVEQRETALMCGHYSTPRKDAWDQFNLGIGDCEKDDPLDNYLLLEAWLPDKRVLYRVPGSRSINVSDIGYDSLQAARAHYAGADIIGYLDGALQ